MGIFLRANNDSGSQSELFGNSFAWTCASSLRRMAFPLLCVSSGRELLLFGEWLFPFCVLLPYVSFFSLENGFFRMCASSLCRMAFPGRVLLVFVEGLFPFCVLLPDVSFFFSENGFFRMCASSPCKMVSQGCVLLLFVKWLFLDMCFLSS